MEPNIIIAGIVALLFLAKGGKRGKKTGPDVIGDVPTPLPTGRGRGPSDPTGPGLTGHIPKGRGYLPDLDRLQRTGIWVSPDCQAWLVQGDAFVPLVEGLSPYHWFVDRQNRGIYDAESPWFDQVVFEYAQSHGLALAEVPDAVAMGRYPDVTSPVKQFALDVLAQEAPLCFSAMPQPEEFQSEEEYNAQINAFLRAYPALDGLVQFLQLLALDGEARSVRLPEIQVTGIDGSVHLAHPTITRAYEDSFGDVGGEA